MTTSNKTVKQLILCLALLCSPAWAAYSVVNHGSCASPCGSGITGGTGTSGNVVFVDINAIAGGSITAPTCTRCGTFTSVGTCVTAPNSACINTFRASLTSSGTYTIAVATGSNCGSFCSGQFYECSGCTTTLDVTHGNPSATGGSGTNALTSGAVTTTAADFCIGYAGAANGPLSVGTLTVAWTSPDGDVQGLAEYFGQTSSGSITAEISDAHASDSYAAMISCFQPAGGATSTVWVIQP